MSFLDLFYFLFREYQLLFLYAGWPELVKLYWLTTGPGVDQLPNFSQYQDIGFLLIKKALTSVKELFRATCPKFVR